MKTTMEHDAWIRIADAAREIGASESAAPVFKQLVQASAAVTPRAAMYLIRRGQIQGWGSSGYDTKSTRRQQAYRAPADSGWLGRLAAAPPTGHTLRTADDDDPDFGQNRAAETAGFVVTISGKPIAVLVVERNEGESPWLTSGIEVLVSLSRLRLELNLASRRSSAASKRKPAPAPRTGLTAEIEPASNREQTDPAMDAARRYARLVATDIRLYNEEAVLLGRRNGDLVDRLGTNLGRGKATFLRRHSDLGDLGLEVLHDAYVQVLAAGDPALIPAKID